MGRNHKDWLKKEFEKKYLKPSYRNVIIHASFIEQLVKRESKRNNFETANCRLFISCKIAKQEFEIFEKIRNKRNRLLHGIIIKKLDEMPINNMIESLMGDILLAYRTSQFLKDNLIEL